MVPYGISLLMILKAIPVPQNPSRGYHHRQSVCSISSGEDPGNDQLGRVDLQYVKSTLDKKSKMYIYRWMERGKRLISSSERTLY
jgi:hypothetical protein